MNKKTVIFTLLLFIITFFATNFNLQAQCAMCKTIVETNKENGGSISDGLNSGILYLMIIPYLAMATVGYLIYKSNKQKRTI